MVINTSIIIMENIYKLSGKAAEIACRYDEIQSEFEALMEENGGELNEESQEMLDKIAELEDMQAQIQEQFMLFPDEYASWYKNVEAEKKVAEAELKAFKELQKLAIAKYEARVKRCESRMEWIKQNLADAMVIAQVDKLDKKRSSDALFSIYFQDSKSIEVDEQLALKDYQDSIDNLRATLPEWLSIEPKIAKSTLNKVEELPQGFERKISRNLQIR